MAKIAAQSSMMKNESVNAKIEIHKRPNKKLAGGAQKIVVRY